jgi:hypothetical protein
MTSQTFGQQKSLSGELELGGVAGTLARRLSVNLVGKANEVIVYSYGGRTGDVGEDQNSTDAV